MLKLGAAVVVLISGLATSALAQTADEIELVQEYLDAYDVGDEDGLLGPQTRGAIVRFQRDWELEETGEVSPELIAMFENKSDKTKPQWTKVLNLECEVWTRVPEPREVITWSGGCEGGKISGTGTLVRTYVLAGATREASYIGSYAAGKRNGRGIAKLAGGDQYDGEFKDDMQHGTGVYTFSDGDKYEGDYLAGKRHGNGVYTFSDGDKYEGTFREGTEHGNGVYSFADGDVYEGEFADGKEHGRGVLRFSGGGFYEGPFERGAAHGRGIFTTASGERELRDFDRGCSPGNEDRIIGVSEDDCKF